MLLAKYIIEKEKISNDLVLDALKQQQADYPGIYLTVLHDSELSANQKVDILDKSFSENISLVKAIQVVAGDKSVERIKNNATGSTPSILDILVSKGSLTEERAKVLLEEYKKIQSGSVVNNAPPAPKKESRPEPKEAPAKPSGISLAALESLRELGNVSEEQLAQLNAEDSSGEENVSNNVEESVGDIEISEGQSTFVTQYVEMFNEKVFKKFIKMVKMVKQAAETGSDIANLLNSFYREFHIVKGVARLAEAKISEKLIDEWEFVLESLFTKSNEQLTKWVTEDMKVLEDSIELLWEIRNLLAGGGSEKNFWNESEKKQKYMYNFKDIKNVVTKI